MNTDAEAGYLGAVIRDNAVLDDYPLGSSDFYHVSMRLIHETMIDMRRDGIGIDLVTLHQALKDAGTLEKAGGLSVIATLPEKAPSAALAATYAGIIKTEAQKRVAARIGEALKNCGDINDISSAFSELVELLAVETKREKTKAERLADFSAWVEKRSKMRGLPGVTTGNQDLDRLTLGWQDGALIILAARPGMGKTALALNFLRDAAGRGYPCKFYSLEMPSEQIFARLAAMENGLTMERIMNPSWMTDDEQSAFIDANVAIESLPLDVEDSVHTQAELTRNIRRDVAQGVKLVIIDYLQLIRGERRENRTQEISGISDGLKRLAVEMKIPIIALSQLSRAVESRNDKRPMLSDLRESGSIEQDADVVMFLYRDGYYNEKTERPWAELEIAKQRNGQGQGRVKMLWYPSKMRFKAMAYE